MAPERAPTSPAQRCYITTLGGARSPPVRRCRSQAAPLAPRAVRPGAPSTLVRRGCQPPGIQLPADSFPKARSHHCRTQQKNINPAAKGGIKNGARKGAHLASAAVLYNYPGRSPEPACKAKPITGRTLGAQGRQARRRHEPSAPQGLSTFGNTAEHRIIPKSPISQMIRAAKKH